MKQQIRQSFPLRSQLSMLLITPQLGTLYQTNKMKHLKKEDGIPLWRKDIQYDFLRHVLRDETKCFTKYSEQTSNHTFAEVYIDAMAKSSKCSKILKDKLLTDPESAITMAMVCLLVNIGRMNTTLNCKAGTRAFLMLNLS
jgi:Ino eighty subunit 1